MNVFLNTGGATIANGEGRGQIWAIIVGSRFHKMNSFACITVLWIHPQKAHPGSMRKSISMTHRKVQGPSIQTSETQESELFRMRHSLC